MRKKEIIDHIRYMYDFECIDIPGIPNKFKFTFDSHSLHLPGGITTKEMYVYLRKESIQNILKNIETKKI